MSAVHLEKWRQTVPSSAPTSQTLGYLNCLRSAALACRAKPQTDLFKACALLHLSKDATQQAYAEALVRCLPQALGKPARLLAPDVQEMTFDEGWLVRLGTAHARKDWSSLQFLVRSRVAHEHQRLVLFLIAQISDGFYPV